MLRRVLVLAIATAPAFTPQAACPPPKSAMFTLTPSTLTFAPQLVKSGSMSPQQTVILKSTGNIAVDTGSITASGDFAETNDCPASLAPQAACTIQVAFAPNQIGAVSGGITINNTQAKFVSLSGTGLPPVSFSPTAVDFGSIAPGTTSSPRIVTLTNNQASSLAISAVSVTGGYLANHNCPSSLPAGQSCSISVSFHPVSSEPFPGAITAATDAAPGAIPVELKGSGSGTVNSALAVSAPVIEFGDEEGGASSASKSITVSNTSGNATLTISSVTVSANFSETDNCAGKMLSPGAACTVSVAFHPPADLAAVAYAGAVTIADSEATSPKVVGLSGRGVQPVSASPDHIDFGHVFSSNQTLPATVTLKNNHTGNEDVSIVSSGGFGQTNSCTNTLAPAATCSIDVQSNFGPLGVVRGAVTVGASSGGFLSPTVVSLSACRTNVGAFPSTLNFGVVPVGATSQPLTVMLANAGADVSLGAISPSGANAADFTVSNNTCTGTLTTVGCTFDITFAPSASGARNAAISIADGDPCSPHQVSLSGGSSSGPFTVSVGESGPGNVVSTPAGINCGSQGSQCVATFASGTQVSLSAAADANSQFTGWGKSCSGKASCPLTMNADKQVTATFQQNPQLTLEFGGNGTGAGTVTSVPAGIDGCTGTCMAYFLPGTSVTLTAVANAGSKFIGWSGGGCTGTATCTVLMNSDQLITAIFDGPAFSMAVSNPVPAAVTPGNSSTATVTVTSTNGFNGAIGLSCAVTPTPNFAPACALNPASVTPPSNGSVTATLTISTVAPVRAARSRETRRLLAILFIPLIGGFTLMAVRSRCTVINVVVLGTVLIALLTLQSCGGASQAKHVPQGGTPAGLYNVVVQGATSNITQTAASVSLTVQ